jgi:drug/metabolite transporter (DMT)-like permease
LLSFIFLKEKLTAIKICLIFLSFIGATLIVSPNTILYFVSFFIKINLHNEDESPHNQSKLLPLFNYLVPHYVIGIILVCLCVFTKAFQFVFIRQHCKIFLVK